MIEDDRSNNGELVSQEGTFLHFKGLYGNFPGVTGKCNVNF
jgi:hypothetical protein